ncbi:MAG: beta-ketoacyl-ACP synthase II [Anaerolineae bacterium]
MTSMLRQQVNRLPTPVRAALLRLLADDLTSDQLHDQPPMDDKTLQDALVSLGEQPEVRPRVVVTGLGALTPLGHSAPASWEAMVAGRSGVGRVTQFDASAYPCQIAAEIKDFDPIAAGVPAKDARRMARCSQITLAAGAEALRDANIQWDDEQAARVGVCMGTGLGGFDIAENLIRQLITHGPGRMKPHMVTAALPNMPAFHLSQTFNCKGPLATVVTACAAGTQAIGEAMEMIRRGAADVMLAGGVEALIGHIFFSGFTAMRAISLRNDEPERASRPFDIQRDGFVIGEGVGIMVLERLEHALERGARIYAEVLGQSASADAYHVAAPQPEGAGAARAMAAALADAGLRPRDVDYINAHGTSTPIGDPTETRAIKQVFGEHAYDLAISSTKSMIGHTFGAAGAIEFMACVYSVVNNLIHPTINLERPDPLCDLDYVPNVARLRPVRVAMSNSFGLGGQNACLVVGKYAA